MSKKKEHNKIKRKKIRNDPNANKTETVENKFSDSLNTCIMRCKTFEPLPVSQNYTPC